MRAAQRRLAGGFLLADLYELTMAQAYFRSGLHEKPALFEYSFRKCPDYGGHQAGFCVFSGAPDFLDWLGEAAVGDEELSCLRNLKRRSGRPLFDEDFLSWLREEHPPARLRAVPEGRVVHPGVPLATVEGQLARAQLVETALLNIVNYQTLVATKAARMLLASEGRTVVEFGARRAQEAAAAAGARAALVGGASASSNVGASAVLGVAPMGTHAHSFVQACIALGEGELGAFRAYAEAYPDDCLLLVDTVDTLRSGVPNAIEVFRELRARGHAPLGIRLDSGDLAYLAVQSHRMLEEAGFGDVAIVLSNLLDEDVIAAILRQVRAEAPQYGLRAEEVISRLVFGAGTRLVTSWGSPALDGVYKLAAVKDGREWLPSLKVCESPGKGMIPGRKEAWRLYDGRGKAVADLLTVEDEDPRAWDRFVLRHPWDPGASRVLERGEVSRVESLLAEVRAGSLEEARARRDADLAALDPGVKRLVNPHVYHVSLSEGLWGLKARLLAGTQRPEAQRTQTGVSGMASRRARAMG